MGYKNQRELSVEIYVSDTPFSDEKILNINDTLSCIACDSPRFLNGLHYAV